MVRYEEGRDGDIGLIVQVNGPLCLCRFSGLGRRAARGEPG